VRLIFELTAPGDFSSAGGSSSGGVGSAANDGTATPVGSLPFPVILPQALLTPASAAAAAAAAAAASTGSTLVTETGAAADEGAVAAAAAAAAYVRCALQHRATLHLPPALELRPHARRLASLLLRTIPGRVWDGKEVLVSALGQLAARCPAEVLCLRAAETTPPPSEQALPVGASSIAGGAMSPLASSTMSDAPPTSTPDSSATALPPSDSATSTAAVTSATVPDPAVTAAAVVQCLTAQVSRDAAPVAYVTAASTALALVLTAAPAPGFDAYMPVAAALEAVLRSRCKRTGLPPLLQLQSPLVIDATNDGAGTTSAAAPASAPAAAAPVVVVGGRFNESTQSEGRLAAKAAESELAGLAGACYTALSAALPPALVASPSSNDGPTSPGPTLPLLPGVGTWLAAYCSAWPVSGPKTGIPPAAFHAALARVCYLSAPSLSTHAAHASRLLAFLTAALTPAAQQPHELASVARSLAVAFSVLLPGTEPSCSSGALVDAAQGLVAAAAAEDKHAAARNACLAATAALLQRSVALGGVVAGSSGGSDGSKAADSFPSPLLPPPLAAWLRAHLLGSSASGCDGDSDADTRLARMPEPHTAQWLRVCAALLSL
jgi:DNA segregation ATPase FtsK/SpoIIIE, S-DNA-T family